MATRKSIAERFWAKVQKTDTCWLWTAAKTPTGYGNIRVAGRSLQSHRLSYEMYHGVALTPEQCILHSCDVRACVNPSHLRIGTRADNRRDFDERHTAWQQTRTHCPQGHAYEGHNLIMRYGRRHCRICMRVAGREFYQRNKAEITAKKRTGPLAPEVRRENARNASLERWRKHRAKLHGETTARDAITHN